MIIEETPERMNKLEELYKENYKQIYGFIASRVQDPFTAEDILQDVFERANSKISSLRNEKKAKNWLFQIARNTLADYYRTRKPSSTIHEAIFDDPSFSESYAMIRLERSVLNMIRHLPASYRNALYLAHYNGLSARQVAVKLNISETCAKSRIWRARKMMREIYLECCHFEFDGSGRVIDYYPVRS